MFMMTKGVLTQTTDAQGNVTQSEYNIFDKETATVDALGRRTEYDYDIRGNLISTFYPDGTSETNEYDEENNLTRTVDRNGNETLNEYDAANRLIKTTFADTSFTSNEYDTAGRMMASVDALGNRTSYGYDAAGRQIEVSDALSNITQYAYDKHGNRTQMTDAKGQIFNYEYDLEDRLVKTIYPDTTFTSTEYDARGRKVSETDQAGITTRYEYDGAGRLTKVIDALTQATAYTYDEQGNKLTQTDALSRTTSWTYDEVGRVLTRTLPMGQVETFTYDAVGNVLTRTDFNNQVTTYTYDNNNRTTSIAYNDGSSESFTYDNNGNRLSATNVQGTWSYQYDVFNRLSQETKPTGEVLEYSYDAAGNKTQMKVTYQDASTRIESFTYDVLNRLESVTDANLGVTSYGYDANGNRESISYANGTSTTYDYDTLNRLINVSHYNGTGGLINVFAYVLDATGKRTQISETNGRVTDYTYDELNRLFTEVITDTLNGNYNAEYTYDKVGNRVYQTIDGIQTALTYDNNDRLTQMGGEHYTYDANGNTLTKTIDSDVVTYGYNAKNKMVSMGSLSTAASYQYNIDGIRIQKTEDSLDTKFLIDTNRDYAQVVTETTSTEKINYTYGDDLVSQSRNATSSYYLYDGLGSTRALTNDAGVVTDTYNYEVFGDTLNKTGTTENNYLYTGEQYDSNLDNYYLRARYYDQNVGRFTQQDTWMGNNSDPITLHKYLYANADPANTIDPTGNFGLASVGAANSIRSILTDVQVNIGFNLFNGALTGESPEAEDAMFGLLAMGGQAAFKMLKLFNSKIRKACNSFDGATLVATNNGLVAIKDIKISDKVWAYNENTGENSLQEVVHIIEGEGGKELVDIKLVSGEVITTTAGHPFYIFENNEWKIASKINLDDEFIDLSGKALNIAEIRPYSEETKVYNITVSNDHTYYVGFNKVLVHNAPECDIGGILVQLGKLKVLKTNFLKKQKVDAHNVKIDILGTNKNIAHWDIVKENKTNKIFLKSKDGKMINSIYTLEQLKTFFPSR